VRYYGGELTLDAMRWRRKGEKGRGKERAQAKKIPKTEHQSRALGEGQYEDKKQ